MQQSQIHYRTRERQKGLECHEQALSFTLGSKCFKIHVAMSTITEIQNAIARLRADEKSALTAWLQSQEEPLMSEAEEAALLASLDEAAAELDTGKGIPAARVREDIRRWAGE